MNDLLKLISLNDEFIFNGTIDKLNEKIRLNNNKNFKTKWLDYNKFKFVASLSIGTLILNGFSNTADGIKGVAELKEIGNNTTKVVLKTSVRIELYLYLTLMFLIITAGILTEADIPAWIFWLIPVGLVWFWFIYRVQEKMLFNKLKRYLLEQ